MRARRGRRALTEAGLALLSARIFRGPDPETDGASDRTLPDLFRCLSVIASADRD